MAVLDVEVRTDIPRGAWECRAEKLVATDHVIAPEMSASRVLVAARAAALAFPS